MVASYLLPFGAIGLAWLAYPRTPWLASIAGLLAVIGWLPFSALTAQDDVTNALAQLPDSASYGGFWDHFTNDPVMLSYLVVYVVGHLTSYVLFGIALGRGRIISWWATWMLAASSPLTLTAFVFPYRLVVGAVALGLVVIGSVPAAVAMIRGRRVPAAT